MDVPLPAAAPRTLHSPGDALALYEDADVRIDHYPRGGGLAGAGAAAGVVVITFDPLAYLWPKPPFGLEFLRRQGVDVIDIVR